MATRSGHRAKGFRKARSRRRAPTNGTMVTSWTSPWAITQAIAACATETPSSAATHANARRAQGCDRGCPTGVVGAKVVAATFYNCNPDLVAKCIPAAWKLASPETVTSVCYEIVEEALPRVPGDVAGSDELPRAATILRRAGRGGDSHRRWPSAIRGTRRVAVARICSWAAVACRDTATQVPGRWTYRGVDHPRARRSGRTHHAHRGGYRLLGRVRPQAAAAGVMHSGQQASTAYVNAGCSMTMVC
jgi:hypothetical protein